MQMQNKNEEDLQNGKRKFRLHRFSSSIVKELQDLHKLDNIMGFISY